MAAIILQMIPSYIANYSKNSLSYSAKTYKIYIVNKEYCIAHHDAKKCSLPNCRNHIFLLGNVEDLLQKLDALCFIYQHVDCLYTMFKYRSSGKSVERSGQKFDNVHRAVCFNHKKQRSGQNTQHREKKDS